MLLNPESAESPRPFRVNAAALRRAVAAGMRRVVARREALNAINVFPVPDGDTGSNLAFTFGSVLAGSLSRRASQAGELLREIAADALDSARGNSGAIFAQFLHGAGETVGEARLLTADSLAHAVKAGAEQAARAIAQPREGTILSVIRAFADALAAVTDRCDVAGWFSSALGQAQRALADTPNHLAVLRQAGVVDAGAQGFVDLLEGIEGFIASGVCTIENVEVAASEFAGAALHTQIDFSRPFCSECVIEGDRLEHAALHTVVAALNADSVVIAGGTRKLRVHAHVAEPGRLFELANRFGRVSARKVDDMRLQHASARHSDRIAVVTDSGADLPTAVAAALNIAVVPARVSFGGEEFLDKVSILPSEFYRRLRESGQAPQTSQPPPGDFRRQFEFLLAHHPALVYVGIARSLSGTLQSAEAVANKLDPQRARVYDSFNGSCGEGLMVIAAAEAAAEGADGAAILARLDALRPRTRLIALARDIRYAVRGGRLPRWAGEVARIFGLTPIARVCKDGRLRPVGALFGERNAPQRFARWIARRVPVGLEWRVMVGHCDCASDGEALVQALRARLSTRAAWLVEAGPAVGAHAGPGALVVGLQPVD